MRSDIHEQIDKNLRLLVNSRNMTMYYSDMLDSDNEKFNRQNGEHFVSFLVKYGLVTNHEERCDITPKGVEISKNGGWLEHRRKKENQRNISQNSENSLRDQERQVRELTVENLKLQNKQLKRFIIYSIIAFISGAILTNIKDILALFN